MCKGLALLEDTIDDAAGGDELAALGGVDTVSYTHLDVYKRQATSQGHEPSYRPVA